MRRLVRAIRSQIRYQIILPYLALTLLVMLVGAAISIALVAASSEERLTNQLAAIGRNTSETLVQRELHHLDLLLQASTAQQNPGANAPAMADAYTSGNPAIVQRALRPYYDEAVSSQALDIDRMIAIDAHGRALVDWLRVSDNYTVAPELIEGTDLSQVTVVKNVLSGTLINGDDKFSDLIVFKPDLQPYFYTIAPVKRNNQIVGTLLIAIKLDRMLASFDRTTQAAITNFYDDSGQPIGSSVLRRPDELPTAAMSEQALAQLKSKQAQSVFTVVETVNIRKVPYELAYSPLLLAGNQVGYFSVGLSRDFQVESVSISRNAIVALTVVLAIGAIVLGYWIARHITVPLAVLVETADAVSAGDLERRTAIHSRDELGRLAQAFNQMTEHLLRLYRTSRELSAHIDVDAVLTVAAQTLQEFTPETDVLALLDDHGVWSYRLRANAAERLQALSNLRIAA